MQGRIEQALATICGQAVETVGAGRTDAGVHAAHQVLHADVPRSWRLIDDLDRARDALDARCGPAITVWRARRVPASFDARFSATQRRYRYRLCDARAIDPLHRHMIWHVGRPALDVAAMEAGGTYLLGEHDFSSFCRRREGRHLVRRIEVLRVRRRPRGVVDVDVAGPAFCHQMVRAVVGCLLRVGRGQREPSWVAQARDARDRAAVGSIAPPHGLTLTAVRFGPSPAA